MPREPVRQQPSPECGHPPSLNPTALNKPAFLMNVPFSLAADVANNAWMDELTTDARKVDLRKAINQFLQLYYFIAAEALVYLLPTPRVPGLQDLVCCANLGSVLEHVPDRNTVVLSNFSTAVRVPETAVGERFFDEMGYRMIRASYHFEGEAELKHLRAGERLCRGPGVRAAAGLRLARGGAGLGRVSDGGRGLAAQRPLAAAEGLSPSGATAPLG